MATLQELIAQKEALELQIQEQRKSDLAYAVASVKALIAEYGLTHEDIFGSASASKKGKGTGTKAKVAAKYRDHESGKEWSGRGIAPKWLQGKDKAQFLIAA
jgi:DNA-binding protein H-NS